MGKRQKLMYKCMVCDTLLSYIGTCNDNILLCPECGGTHLVTFDGAVLKSVMRLSKRDNSQKLTYKCLACNTVLSLIGTCNDSILPCRTCGSTHLVSFGNNELRAVIRFSKQAAVSAAFRASSCAAMTG